MSVYTLSSKFCAKSRIFFSTFWSRCDDEYATLALLRTTHYSGEFKAGPDLSPSDRSLSEASFGTREKSKRSEWKGLIAKVWRRQEVQTCH